MLLGVALSDPGPLQAVFLPLAQAYAGLVLNALRMVLLRSTHGLSCLEQALDAFARQLALGDLRPDGFNPDFPFDLDHR